MNTDTTMTVGPVAGPKPSSRAIPKKYSPKFYPRRALIRGLKEMLLAKLTRCLNPEQPAEPSFDDENVSPYLQPHLHIVVWDFYGRVLADICLIDHEPSEVEALIRPRVSLGFYLVAPTPHPYRHVVTYYVI